MKNGLFTLSLLFLFVSGLYAEDNRWTIGIDQPVWSRDDHAIKTTLVKNAQSDGSSAVRLEHTGNQDWAVSGSRIDVKPGDIFELSCLVKPENDIHAQTGVVLYNKDEAKHWIYGGCDLYQSTKANDGWQRLESRFIVPPDTTAIMPRFTGSGSGSLLFKDYVLKRAGDMPLTTTSEIFTLENSCLKVDFDAANGSFSVLDKRIGRTWRQYPKNDQCLIFKPLRKDSRTLAFSLIFYTSQIQLNAILQLDENLPELTVTLDGKKDQPLMGQFAYPLPFYEPHGDRIILPLNEGISFPVEEQDPRIGYLYTYGGHGLCMAFFGQIRDEIDPKKANGYLGIIESPDDAAVQLLHLPTPEQKSQSLALSPRWENQKKSFGYARTIRYVFFDQGGHVALCKRYREHAKKNGLYVPFTEKIKRNPNLKDGLDRLVGAANIWSFGGRNMDRIREMKSLGMDRLLWSAGGSAEQLAEMNKIDGVLSSRYDIYQDLMNPELIPLTGMKQPHGDWTQDAWPKDVNWIKPDGTPRIGWSIDAKDKTKPRIPCVVLCDRQAIPYAEKRIGNELKTKPYKARFIDTTVAAPWFECWNPDHPMTRTDSRIWKMKLLALLGQRFNLVTGSETGHEASVPFCDFYEGMMSLGPYRVPESGRYLDKIWDEVPPYVEKYQTGESFRLPLWELVYHDCTVSYWYWGDYNNKLPKLWDKRDLFNALYGVPPMYLFNDAFWNKNKDRFAASYKVAQPVSRLTGMTEMTNHCILSSDRKVQRTEFANGVKVTVNFGDTPWKLEDGSVLPPGRSKIDQNQ